MDSGQIVDSFHRLYYERSSDTWQNTYWLGVPVYKCPLDLWVYQEILQEVRPDTIIETGTWRGGSALFLASVCDILGKGRIVTVDISSEPVPEHPRIHYLHGSSTSEPIFKEMRMHSKGEVLVILDSDHHKDHVAKELEMYSSLVTVGSYLIVEDTNINGFPVLPGYGPGPKEAVTDFLRERADFIPDFTREKFFMTFNPGGYLQRRTLPSS